MHIKWLGDHLHRIVSRAHPCSRMTIATAAPDRNVNAAIDKIASAKPKRSAMRPADSAPIA